LGVSVEKVVATIEIPSNHQGIFLPDKKYSEELEEDFLETQKPIIRVVEKNPIIINISSEDKSIICVNILLNLVYYSLNLINK
jgi:hypothetical protein